MVVRIRQARWAAIPAVAAVLLLAYLRVAATVPQIFDGTSNALQAWDMLHGNVLLHGWWVSDVSFWTTELPELMVVEAFAGLRPDVVHIGTALTYTVLVLLVAFAARGRARGAEGWARALVAGVIMLAPEPGDSALTALGAPDHVGTAAPVLVVLLLLDVAVRRWWVPVAAGVILAWSTVGDPVTVVVGVVPLALVGLARGVGGLARGRGIRGVWFEASLVVAAVAAYGAATGVNHLIPALGGFREQGLQTSPVPLARVPGDIPHAARSVLLLFGADWESAHGTANVAFALAHLAGVAAVLAAVALAAGRLSRLRRGDLPGKAGSDLVADILVVAIAANLAGFLTQFSIARPVTAAHEIGPVLALGAALAGRVLGGPLSRVPGRIRLARVQVRLMPVVAAVVVAGYAVMLGFAAAQPPVTPPGAALSTWMVRHGLRGGLSGYWHASSIRLASGGAVSMVCVEAEPRGQRGPRVGPWRWETDLRLASASAHTVNALVLAPGDSPVTPAQASAVFGRPARVYHAPGAMILVWNQNLLRELGRATHT